MALLKHNFNSNKQKENKVFKNKIAVKDLDSTIQHKKDKRDSC